MNIIFLGVDGVLNSTSGLIQRGSLELMDTYDEHLRVLMWLVDKAEANIVVSSSWRLRFLRSRDWTAMTDMILRNKTSKYRHLAAKVLGATPSLKEGCRGDEIFEWVHEYEGEIDEFVIIDEDDDMGPYMDHLVRTNNSYGLTYVEARKALVKLVGETEAQKRTWTREKR